MVLCITKMHRWIKKKEGHGEVTALEIPMTLHNLWKSSYLVGAVWLLGPQSAISALLGFLTVVFGDWE